MLENSMPKEDVHHKR